MKDFFRQMLSGENGRYSSKRVVAFLLTLVVAFMYIRCNICGCVIDDHITELIVAVLVLLGCDSVVNIFGVFKKGGSND